MVRQVYHAKKNNGNQDNSVSMSLSKVKQNKNNKKSKNPENERGINKKKKGGIKNQGKLNVKKGTISKIVCRFSKFLKLIFDLFLLIVILLGVYFFIQFHELIEFYKLVLPGKQYLIVMQNDAELRPTGGFIGSYGILTTKWGKPEIEIFDSYELVNHEPEDAPNEIKKLLKHPNYEGHFFRDANIYPDWQKSAEELARMYNLNFDKDIKFDGLIAVNFNVLNDFIKEFGPLEIDGVKLNDDNLFYTLEYELRPKDAHNIEELETRKNMLKPLAKELMYKFVSPKNWRKINAIAVDALNEKNVQMYFYDKNTQELAEEKDWAGIMTSQGFYDFLHINIANYGGGKSDRYIDRNVDYSVEINKEGNAYAELNLKLKHKEVDSLFTGDWKGWIRIYVPKNIEVLKKSNGFEVQKNENYYIFESVVYLPVKSDKEFYFKYKLPDEYVENYSLNVKKQSGTNDLYNIDISTPNQFFWNSDSKDFDLKENHLEFKGVLKSDLEFKGNISPDNFTPFITDQFFESYTTITVYISEPLLSNNVKRENFKIIDLDKEFVDISDEVKVVSASINYRTLTLRVKGVSEQVREHYSLCFEGLEDLNGNVMSNGCVTLVQRF